MSHGRPIRSLAGLAVVAVVVCAAVAIGIATVGQRPAADAGTGSGPCTAALFNARLTTEGSDAALEDVLPQAAAGALLKERHSEIGVATLDGPLASACAGKAAPRIHRAWAWSTGLDGWGLLAVRADGVPGSRLEQAYIDWQEASGTAAVDRSFAGRRFHSFYDDAAYRSGDTLFVVEKFAEVDVCLTCDPNGRCGCPAGYAPPARGEKMWEALLAALP